MSGYVYALIEPDDAVHIGDAPDLEGQEGGWWTRDIAFSLRYESEQERREAIAALRERYPDFASSVVL